MTAKIGANKVPMMKTDDLVNAAKTGKPKAKAKARVELHKRGKADLLNKTEGSAE